MPKASARNAKKSAKAQLLLPLSRSPAFACWTSRPAPAGPCQRRSAQSAADLCILHRLWRGRSRRRPAGFRRQRLFRPRRSARRLPLRRRAAGVVMPGQGDRAAAIALAMGIMVALEPGETGRGTKVSSSLFANGIWANIVQGALLGASIPKRPPPHTPRSAVSNLYRVADERWVQLSVVDEPKQFPVLCKALDREFCITDPPFTTRVNSTTLAAIFAEAFAAKPRSCWRERLKSCGLPFAAINRASDLADHEQAVAAGIFVETANPELALTLAPPFAIADAPLPPARPGPMLGEHSTEILAEAGLTPEEIAALKSRGVVE